MELSRYLTMFQDEGREALERLSDLFLKLERSPDDVEIIHDIFRTIHSFTNGIRAVGKRTETPSNSRALLVGTH